MIDTYFPIFVLMILAAGFVLTMLLLSIFLGPKRYSAVKDQPFECGTIPTGDAGARHSVRFYLVAMTFIVFDVEVVFLYPWALQVKQMGWLGFWAVLPFLMILSLGLVYEWKRGALEVI